MRARPESTASDQGKPRNIAREPDTKQFVRTWGHDQLAVSRLLRMHNIIIVRTTSPTIITRKILIVIVLVSIVYSWLFRCQVLCGFLRTYSSSYHEYLIMPKIKNPTRTPLYLVVSRAIEDSRGSLRRSFCLFLYNNIIYQLYLWPVLAFYVIFLVDDS